MIFYEQKGDLVIWNPKFEKNGEILLNCVYFLIFGTKLDILPILAEISVNRWKLADIILRNF